MNVRDIKRITYNPFWCSSLLPYFLSGFKDEQVHLEIAFLLFPMVLYKDSREILSNCNVRSNIYSAFLDNKEGRESLAGIEKRYLNFRNLTNKSLIVASSKEQILFGKIIKSNKSVDFTTEKDSVLREYYKASKYLGILFTGFEPLDIFLKLGIRQL